MAFKLSENELDLKSIGELSENPMLARLNSIRAKGRLSFVTPTENQGDTQVLTFEHTTKAQERTRKRQQPKKLEPLVRLKTSILATFGCRGSCRVALGDGNNF